MEPLGEVLNRITQKKTPSLSTGECWCGGVGGHTIRYMAPFGQYSEAQAVFDETCVCEVGQQEAQRKEQLQWEYNSAQTASIARLRWQNSGVPQRFIDYRLSTSPIRAVNSKLIERLTCPSEDIVEWDDAFDRWWGSWYFHGPYGVGKTGLAVGFAYEMNVQAFCEASQRIRFVTLPRLLAELRSTYNRRGENVETEQDVIDRYAKTTLLILDDLGAEHVKGSGWVEDRLYQVIGERHDEERVTVFTSNLSLKELANHIGERITWRILEMCGPERIVAVTGPNLRDVRKG